jgi:hypothetical protein
MTVQPSSDEPEPTRGSPLRRYGPIAGVLVVIALIAGVAVVSGGGGDDEDGGDGSATGTTRPLDGELPDGVVTWSMAQEEDLDVEFPDTCDTDEGMVAIPFFFRTECVANVDDNGGATSDGVTGDEITVAVWLPNPDDPIFGIIRDGLGFDDSVDEIRETYGGLIEIFQAYYQTYGRTVNVEFVEASGSSLDSVAARADAAEAIALDPFAVLGGPLLANTWTEELHANDIVCLACPGISDPEPTSFGLVPTTSQVREHVVGYVSTKLAGKPAEFAGDDLQDEDRLFAYLRMGLTDSDEDSAQRTTDALEEAGVDVAETIVYPLDPVGIQEHATSAVTRMKQAGVTTVLVEADPITLPAMTQEATKQDWYPEWVLSGFPFTDTSAFGRQMDQDQWAHAFGISYLPPASRPEIIPAYQLYEWYHGEPPPADESLLLTYPQVALLFTGLEFAGPGLTPETFQQAAFAYPPTPRAVTQPSLDYGTEVWNRDDYGGIDDFVELWWNPDAEGEDETGNAAQGLYEYVDGGQRYYADEYTDELKVFDPEGAVTEITDPPPAEIPPEYPPPDR